MASLAVDLQRSLDQFAAECKAPGMRISTSKSEAMVLSRDMHVQGLKVRKGQYMRASFFFQALITKYVDLFKIN